MAILRVKSDVRSAVWDASVGGFVGLKPGDEYDEKDPVVKQAPWAFQSDAVTPSKVRARSALIEQATAEPGELRNR